MPSPKRLEIYYANLKKTQGTVQYGRRPVVIVQNDVGNHYARSIIVVPMTSRHKKELPTHVVIGSGAGCCEGSVILCEQITTISLYQLEKKIGEIKSEEVIRALNKALEVAVGLDDSYNFKQV